MARVFISYKRADKDKVFPLKDKIEAAIGEPCWIDLEGIESDNMFEDIIIKAINQAVIFLFMYSYQHTKINDSDDDWTLREINYAKLKKKRIVFVNIDNAPLTDWFLWKFGSQQQIDANSSEAFQRLIIDLQKWLGKGYVKNQLLEEKPVVQQPVIGKLPNKPTQPQTFVSRVDDKETNLWLASKSTYSGLQHYVNTYSRGKYIKEAKRKIVLYKILKNISILFIVSWPMLLCFVLAALDVGVEYVSGFFCFFLVYGLALNIVIRSYNRSVQNGESHWLEPVVSGFKRLFRF